MLKIEHKGMFLFALFYLVAGVANLVILGMFGPNLFHVALIAVLSLIAAFGLYRLQRWSLFVVVGLLFISVTYGAIMLNISLESYGAGQDVSNLLAVLVWIIYMVLTLVATIYVIARRENLK